MPPPDDLDGLSHAELKGVVVKQWEQMVELQRLVAALRDEIARLKSGFSNLRSHHRARQVRTVAGLDQGQEPGQPCNDTCTRSFARLGLSVPAHSDQPFR